MLRFRIGSAAKLTQFIAAQLDSLFPDDGRAADIGAIDEALPAALGRIRPILAAARNFQADVLDHLYGPQYATLLYLIGNEAHSRGQTTLRDRLFALNRTLHCLDLFPAINMPRVFLIAHGLGTVFANVAYGERLVVFQNVTIGRVGDDRPSIGADVVIYSGAVVTGTSEIGAGSVIAAGTVVHNRTVSPASVVMMRNGRLCVSPRTRDFTDLYFRDR